MDAAGSGLPPPSPSVSRSHASELPSFSASLFLSGSASLSETDLILGETTVNAELVLKAGLLLGAGGEVLVDLSMLEPSLLSAASPL